MQAIKMTQSNFNLLQERTSRMKIELQAHLYSRVKSRRWAKFVTSVVGAEAEPSSFKVLFCFGHFRNTVLLDSILMVS